MKRIDRSTPHRPLRRVAASAFVAVLSAGALAACGDDPDPVPLEVSDGWSRQPAEGQTRSAAYGIVVNPSEEDVTIVSADAEVSERVELHETIMDGDTMQMREREDGFVVPAGESFTFEPGGPHVMLFDVDPAAYPESFDVTLTLDNGESLTYTAEVREIADGAMGGMDHGEMDHGDGEMDHGDGEMDHGDGEMDHGDG